MKGLIKKSFIILSLIVFSIVALVGCKNDSIKFNMINTSLSFSFNNDSNITEDVFYFNNFIERYEFVIKEEFQSDNEYAIQSYTEFRLLSSKYNDEYFETKDLLIVFKYYDTVESKETDFVERIYKEDDNLIILHKKPKRTNAVVTGFTQRVYFIEIEKQTEIKQAVVKRQN